MRPDLSACKRSCVRVIFGLRCGGWNIGDPQVVIETHALLLARLRDGRRHALASLDQLEQTQVRVERIRAKDEQDAIALVRKQRDKDYSLCDALSFVVMKRLRMKESIAFDRHFRAYGRFIVL